MTIEFDKTGKRTNSFLGDRYRSEYSFTTLNGVLMAKLIYADFNSTLEFEGKTFHIKPVIGILTIKKYLILEGDSAIGQIRMLRWCNRLSIELQSGHIYTLKRVYKSFWERFTNGSDYSILLQGQTDQVYYSFTKGARFENGYFNERFRGLRGQIKSDTNSLPISFLGVFLIEQLLDQERD